MRLRLFLLIWIFAFCIQLSNSKAADPVSDVILPFGLPFGRVVNAIILQKHMSDNPNIATTVVGELINVDTSSFEEIAKANLKEQVSQLSEASTFIDEIPRVDTNHIEKTINGLQALKKVKKEESRLTEESFQDPTALLKSSTTLEKDLLKQSKNIDRMRFEEVEKILKDVEKIEAKNVDPENLKAWLKKLQTEVRYCESSIKRISDYNSSYALFYKFGELSSIIGPYLNISRSIASITKNFDNITEIDSAVPTLTKQSNDLRSSKSSFEKFSALFKTIGETIELAERVSRPTTSTKQYSKGLSNGYQDLKTLIGDIQSVGRVVTLRNDTIQEYLGPLSRTYVTLEKAKNELMSIDSTSQLLNAFQNYGTVFTAVSASAQQASEDIEKKLEAFGPCIKQLKKPVNVPDFKQLDTIREHVSNIDKKLSSFDMVMKDMNGHEGFSNFEQQFAHLRMTIGDLKNSADYDTQKKKWDEIRQLNFYKNHSIFFSIIKKLDLDPFELGGSGLPVSILSETLDSAKTLNLFEALKCLPESSPDISRLIDSGKMIDNLKNEKSKLTEVTPILTAFLNFKHSLNQSVAVVRETGEMEKTRWITGHNRLSDDDIKKVEKFIVSTILLNDAEKIRKSDSSIAKVVNSSDIVKQTVEQIQGAEVYNDEFRKSLSGLLSSVQVFFNTTSSMPSKTLKDVLKIVDNLSELRRHSLKDVNKLSDPIAKGLANNSDPYIKKTAKDFEKVGILRMDFSSFENVSGLERALHRILHFFLQFPKGGILSEKKEKSFWRSTGGQILFGFLAFIGAVIIGLIVVGILRYFEKMTGNGKKKS